MSTNPYAPPSARVDDVNGPDPTVKTPFFAVSPLKLMVMSLCTLKLYDLYWFYMHWKLVRKRESSNISPFWRAFFSVFFCFSLFKRMRSEGQSHGLAKKLAAGPLALGWIVFSVASRLPDPAFLIGFLSIAFLWPAQVYVNAINTAASPGHDPNAAFTSWNWVAFVFGFPFSLLVIASAFVTEF